MGKLIVFEGTDGSGKATQSALLCQELEKRGIAFRKLEFPRYQEESSALIRLYLGGAFGSAPDDVNAYAASTFYSVDRYASYKQDWGGFYESGGLLIADRYTTSNAVHQTSKLPPEKRDAFLDWLFDFEYHLLGRRLPIPRPIFTRRTRRTSAAAAKTPPMWWRGAAGRGSTAQRTARPA